MDTIQKRDIKCLHCGYVWSYGGKNQVYCICPKCFKNNFIDGKYHKPRPRKGKIDVLSGADPNKPL
jgi:predicted  nucleic acid-binding Zn-ribbon protein